MPLCKYKQCKMKEKRIALHHTIKAKKEQLKKDKILENEILKNVLSKNNNLKNQNELNNSNEIINSTSYGSVLTSNSNKKLKKINKFENQVNFFFICLKRQI